VVDEASMVDLPLMSKLIQAVSSEARLILLGDKDQLASVEAGAVLGDICDAGNVRGFSREFSNKYGQITGDRAPLPETCKGNAAIGDCVVQLMKNYRFGIHTGIGRLSRAVKGGAGKEALNLLKSNANPEIRWRPLPAADSLPQALRGAVLEGYGTYLEAEDPLEAFARFDRFRILCALRKGPYGVGVLNSLVEKILERQNWIPRDRVWYRGRPVIIKRNDYNLKLFNGDIGLVLPDPAAGNELRAFFLSPEGDMRKILPIRLPDHETVYALTTHQSQGSEFDRVIFVLPDWQAPVITRELIYTAITRARAEVEVWGRESLFVQGVEQRIRRTSGLRDALSTF
jgi:exodeoxyribonuclease V alpha subunit